MNVEIITSGSPFNLIAVLENTKYKGKEIEYDGEISSVMVETAEEFEEIVRKLEIEDIEFSVQSSKELPKDWRKCIADFDYDEDESIYVKSFDNGDREYFVLLKDKIYRSLTWSVNIHNEDDVKAFKRKIQSVPCYFLDDDMSEEDAEMFGLTPVEKYGLELLSCE